MASAAHPLHNKVTEHESLMYQRLLLPHYDEVHYRRLLQPLAIAPHMAFLFFFLHRLITSNVQIFLCSTLISRFWTDRSYYSKYIFIYTKICKHVLSVTSDNHIWAMSKNLFLHRARSEIWWHRDTHSISMACLSLSIHLCWNSTLIAKTSQ